MRFTLLVKYFRAHATTILFITGFIFDAIILPNLEDIRARFIGILYLCLIALFIFIREWIVSRNTANSLEKKAFSIVTFGISYFSGSALSFVFIYTLRSGALSVSWPLFVVLFICILANEAVSTHNFRFTLDVAIFFIAMLFFTVFIVPFFTKEQNDETFLLSLGIALVLSLLYVTFLKRSSETAEYEAPRSYALAVGIPMFVGMMYFLNVIPAVPLSLRESGIYHKVERFPSGAFEGLHEPITMKLARFRTQTYHLTPYDDGIYFFSSIYAPAELTAPISHVWEYYNETQKKWVESTIISFDLAGGRTDGYRAYSQKQNITEGLWRVTVKVDTNRIVGRQTFRVKKVSDVVGLQKVEL
jgi:hypothetical protein